MKSQSQPKNTHQLIQIIKKQAGMTLMEIIAALAIIAAVVVGALSLFNSASSSNQAVTMLKNVIAIRAAVQQLYLGQGGYTAIAKAINNQIHDSNKYPSDLTWNDTDKVFRTSWNGQLGVEPNGTAPAPNFTITLTKVPPEICSQLVTNASNGWSETKVNSKVVGSIAKDSKTPYPVTPTDANTNCGSVSTGVDVAFTTVN